MLDAEQFFSWNARENKAIACLCAALDDVLRTGRSSHVECFPGSLSNREFVAIAVDLCKRAEVNVAVLGNRTANALTLVPLVAAVPRRPAARRGTVGSLAGVGTSGDIFVRGAFLSPLSHTGLPRVGGQSTEGSRACARR
jgi:hypothetical protein